MRLHPLGHAMHLVEAVGLRLLFDPLLWDQHHGGVFEVAPPRRIDAAALRPDFVFVSHRHPDHFDVPSLRALAALDPDTVVVTPDALVARTARRLGFRQTRVIGPETKVDLDGLSLVTTPSRANDAPVTPEALEWGVALADDEACLWNQVDTVLRDEGELDEVRARLERALGARLALALVRWCPLLEVDAALGRAFGFPYQDYASSLAQAAALASAGVRISPSAAGARHAAPFEAMNALVYPLDEARFLDDLRARVPALRALPSSVGRVVDVASGEDLGPSPLARATPFDDDRVFRPLALPPLRDPFPCPDDATLANVRAWIEGPLAEACRGLGRCVLEVVSARDTEVFTLDDGATRRGDDRDWDRRNAVAAAWLAEVLAGRRCWGDLLLAGLLRAATRAYALDDGALRPRGNPIFLYAALPYATSFERALDWQLSRSDP